ncbi:hypothetical protein EJB05_18928 [Eragrostis curvula]|uniref:Box C/D snoRNA protein 1 n=1 Tax=Eragrostis curvula TaxID=38414 RepID=A0A5J9VMG6_9POAL|nr:hypothetical protein EJB05_18928 [Eragrostis curvula]
MEDDREEPPPARNAGPDGSSSSGGGGKKGSPCEECGEQPWKYRCPGCAHLTCSLPCVQAHKRRTDCTGKRPRTDPVPLARFDDNQLISDYNLLEETNQARESAHRLITGFGRNYGGPGGAQLPTWLFHLRKAAQRRGIKLYFLPRGMARREHNRHDSVRLGSGPAFGTCNFGRASENMKWGLYVFSIMQLSFKLIRKNCIYWTLEWKFNSADVVLTDHEIDEHATLHSLLEKHLSPGPWKDHLTQYRNTELRDLKLFIQKSAKDSDSPYRQLNVEEPLGPQLRGTLIVEYPTINVFLPSDNFDFEVEKMVKKLTKNEKPHDSSTVAPHVEGTEFHEEEIEEGEFAPDTQIIDLKDSGPSQPTNLAPVETTSKSKRDNSIDSSVLSCVDLTLSKRVLATTTGAPKTERCMELYPLDKAETTGVGLASKMHDIDLKGRGSSHPGNPAGAEGAAISKIDTKTDSLVPSSISVLTSDGVSGPQQEHSEQSKQTPNATPEALKRKSGAKVYPLLDVDDNHGLLFPEAPDLGFEQDMRDNYPELFGDVENDDFFNIEMINGEDPVEAMVAYLLGGDVEEGEIPGASDDVEDGEIPSASSL